MDSDPGWDAQSLPASLRAGHDGALPHELDDASRPSVVPSDDEVIARIRDYHRGRRLPPPATAEAVASAEALAGYPMPSLLKRIYLEVADGRFDDRASALPLRDAVIRSNGTTDWRDLPDEVPDVCVQGPAGVVPLRFWGCSVWTHVDWRTPEGRLWGEDEGYVYPEKFTLAQRLIRWMDGHEDFPLPLRERGRPVWIDGADDDWWHFTGIRSLDDDKVWRISKFRHGHKNFPRGTAATIMGPLPGGGQGETEVILTHQPQQGWWWMDLDLP